jgi:hypothetical protein
MRVPSGKSPGPGREGGQTGLSYHLCYHHAMAIRTKRSISLPPDLAVAIERAAQAEGTTVSGWITDAATHRLRLDAGRSGIAEWEAENGPLTAEELADGLTWARSVLPSDRSAPRRA